MPNSNKKPTNYTILKARDLSARPNTYSNQLYVKRYREMIDSFADYVGGFPNTEGRKHVLQTVREARKRVKYGMELEDQKEEHAQAAYDIQEAVGHWVSIDNGQDPGIVSSKSVNATEDVLISIKTTMTIRKNKRIWQRLIEVRHGAQDAAIHTIRDEASDLQTVTTHGDTTLLQREDIRWLLELHVKTL